MSPCLTVHITFIYLHYTCARRRQLNLDVITERNETKKKKRPNCFKIDE